MKGTRQVVGAPKAVPVRRLVVVFVKIDDQRDDLFYVLTWERLRDLLVKAHKAYLEKHAGSRPKRWDSLHAAISEDDLRPYRNKWNTVEKNLR